MQEKEVAHQVIEKESLSLKGELEKIFVTNKKLLIERNHLKEKEDEVNKLKYGVYFLTKDVREHATQVYVRYEIKESIASLKKQIE